MPDRDVKRIDDICQGLRAGRLRSDPRLSYVASKDVPRKMRRGMMMKQGNLS